MCTALKRSTYKVVHTIKYAYITARKVCMLYACCMKTVCKIKENENRKRIYQYLNVILVITA